MALIGVECVVPPELVRSLDPHKLKNIVLCELAHKLAEELKPVIEKSLEVQQSEGLGQPWETCDGLISINSYQQCRHRVRIDVRPVPVVKESKQPQRPKSRACFEA